MPPDRIDPLVNYKRFHQLSDEFTNVWKQLQALYLDAAAGFVLVRAHVEQEQSTSRAYVQGSELDSEEFQDTLMFTYDRIFSESFCTSGIHNAKQGEVKARNAPDGANFIILGQLCLVSFYDFWNEYLRREYVVAKGKLDPNEKDHELVKRAVKEHASHDLWGDISQLRRSIVHHRGFAVSEVTQCRLIKWFQPGDSIALNPDRMRTLFLALLKFRNELFKEQFPEPYIQLQARAIF
ncbi:MAG: hypothetical protein BVN29_04840 [Nitrospira sp. ST-bin5]|nr:MAG: hypothetical protein BVN29_04840 [Nitrospira sp. ST-bin5]